MTHIFADSIADLQLVNGNVRVTLTQAGRSDGETVEVARLILPANRAESIVRGMARGLEDIAGKLREARAAQEETQPN
ncbi:MAG: hypothetical protein AAFR52_16675 [Pseudomonadota bacterium]